MFLGSKRQGSLHRVPRRGFMLHVPPGGEAGRGEKCENRWKCNFNDSSRWQKTQECIRTRARRHLRAPPDSAVMCACGRGLAPLPDSGWPASSREGPQAQRWRLGDTAGLCEPQAAGKTCGHWVGSRGFPGQAFWNPAGSPWTLFL